MGLWSTRRGRGDSAVAATPAAAAAARPPLLLLLLLLQATPTCHFCLGAVSSSLLGQGISTDTWFTGCRRVERTAYREEHTHKPAHAIFHITHSRNARTALVSTSTPETVRPYMSGQIGTQ